MFPGVAGAFPGSVDPPQPPRTLAETGLPVSVLENLLLKTLYVQGGADTARLSEIVRLTAGSIMEHYGACWIKLDRC